MDRRWTTCTCITLAILAASCTAQAPGPTQFRVDGLYSEYAAGSIAFRDGYAWRQPQGDTTHVLLTDRRLVALPVDDAYAVIDLALLLGWTRAPYVELELDAAGKLAAVWARHQGGRRVRCAQNAGQCYSKVAYWGPDALTASYAFGDDLDLTASLRVHRQSLYQTPLAAEQRVAPDGRPAQPDATDHDRMAERYARVRAAFDEGGVEAFLEANGFDVATRQALAGFEGMTEAIARLATACPRAEAYEAFGNDGGWGSLLASSDKGDSAVYFLRRGDAWVLHSCGS
ncbi:hypothetical protein [Tahibacter amnicola]|uniref:Uncharacterized protein n=1 Tax=Tahibacter amnicola TaxID=2976241 RepID=A0ABY6BGE2_9GAMM|nr:hypothetical protein [Tahibacter amnicola]UXI68829.1 hypothetical protein N4264_04010 [Tahibacter amnicola]